MQRLKKIIFFFSAWILYFSCRCFMSFLRYSCAGNFAKAWQAWLMILPLLRASYTLWQWVRETSWTEHRLHAGWLYDADSQLPIMGLLKKFTKSNLIASQYNLFEAGLMPLLIIWLLSIKWFYTYGNLFNVCANVRDAVHFRVKITVNLQACMHYGRNLWV